MAPIPRRPMNPTLRPALLAAALVTIAVGVVLYLTVDEVVGIVVIALGIVELLTMPLVLGLVARNRAGAPASSSTPTEPDPTYNPYARED